MGPKRKASSTKSSPESEPHQHATPSKSSKSRKDSAPSSSSGGAALKAPRIPHRTTGLSPLSTDVEDAADWEIMKENAKLRIDSYVPVGEAIRNAENILKPSLHALLEWLPPGGRDHHARIILNARSDKDLWEHFWNVCCYLAAPMKTSTRYSSTVDSAETKSAHHSAVASTLTEPQGRLKEFSQPLLRRDNHCCVVSSIINYQYAEETGLSYDIPAALTEGAHITPYSYASWKTLVYTLPIRMRTKRTSAWTFLYESFPALRNTIHAESINDPVNGMTLLTDLHTWFGDFRLAFEATDRPNEYKILTFGRPLATAGHIPEKVTFTNAAPDDISLPSPVLLHCHCVMAKIFHVSGMGETVEKFMRKWDDLKQGPGSHALRGDGKSDLDKFLSAALWEYIRG
ncbi:Pc18g02560 [Penicillium rubens Wisconsin 54-1255]|uniref:Pc18g02560 protein n=1 Tax=Penicillium rubens (strain ATCC 28089 / DSM 1075 / NRRL 1951 / Wisconsin 54-1255) TaxID=500485 RepID=B6HCX9_PENRW|nr:hypothetical protein N7534_010100 [Penicillium rubens]CAP94480.1 Pc18g02560 [Penicillium rubens Wisconsin 54-1255]